MSKYDGDLQLAFWRLSISSQLSFSEVDAAFFSENRYKVTINELCYKSLLSQSQTKGYFLMIFGFSLAGFLASNSNSSAYLVRTSKDGLKTMEEEENLG